MKFEDINPFVRFAKVEPRKISTHIMRTCDNRLFYCPEDNNEIEVDFKRYSLKKGTFLFLRANVPYRYIENCPALFCCNFDFTQKNNTILHAIPPSEDRIPPNVFETDLFEDYTVFNHVLLLENAFFMEEFYHTIEKEYTECRIYYNLRCSAILKDILATAARCASFADTNEKQKLSEQVLSYIQSNYFLPLTNEKIGKRFRYHPNYLNRLFLKTTGMPMHKYLLTYRIKQAIILLQKSEKSVTEVAENVGMPDINHFSKCFKRLTGNPPSAYRNKD